MINIISMRISDPIGYNTKLNPKLWLDNHLKEPVRNTLLRIAADFKEFVDVPFDIIDVVMTGGNANYNYTQHSDIDLHFIADLSSISCDREANELFDTKRHLYKKTYDVNIYGIPVELYVEDKDTPAVSGGSYSILHDKWVKVPNPDLPKYDESAVAEMVEVWKGVLKQAMQTESLESCRTAVSLLRKYRKLGLGTEDAEFSVPNLVYKSLRNDHTLGNMTEYIDQLHDQELSI